MLTEYHYKEQYTIRFTLKFEHKKYGLTGQIFQKEFIIEHHSEEKGHKGPHLQLHIHGPAPEEKVGEIWITLQLKNEKEYIGCIKGFLHTLKTVINKCEPGLEEEILNIKEIETLITERQLLLTKIFESLNTKGIEYQPSNKNKIHLTPKNITKILEKDITLIPFFKE
jgi:small nuclear ribonucleoprotein (snRNP)-like protein